MYNQIPDKINSICRFRHLSFESTHYGYFNEDPRAKFDVMGTQFVDIPRPFVLDKSCRAVSNIRRSGYVVDPEFLVRM